jgi:CheY-like chemotaxis protein
VLANAEPVEPESAAGSSDASGTETVLVAEDDQAVRDLCRRLLQGLGYTVLVARDGVEALELCTSRDGPIHLLVTDVVMPRLGGRELGQRVSALRPEMPVIYTSGYTETAFGEDGTLPRGVAFLPKPFTGSSLAGKVREVLDRAARAGR